MALDKIVSTARATATGGRVGVARSDDGRLEVKLGLPKGFSVDVALEVHIPGPDHAAAEKLVHEAHEMCPYSNVTRNKIDVVLSVV